MRTPMARRVVAGVIVLLADHCFHELFAARMICVRADHEEFVEIPAASFAIGLALRRERRAIKRAKALRFAFQCGFELLECLCGLIRLEEPLTEQFPRRGQRSW